MNKVIESLSEDLDLAVEAGNEMMEELAGKHPTIIDLVRLLLQ